MLYFCPTLFLKDDQFNLEIGPSERFCPIFVTKYRILEIMWSGLHNVIHSTKTCHSIPGCNTLEIRPYMLLEATLTLFDMGFFEPSVMGEPWCPPSAHNFVVIAPLII